MTPVLMARRSARLGDVAADKGDLEGAISRGRTALAMDRRSRPLLLLVGSKLDTTLQERYANEREVRGLQKP
jgi:hypothetical protein